MHTLEESTFLKKKWVEATSVEGLHRELEASELRVTILGKDLEAECTNKPNKGPCRVKRKVLFSEKGLPLVARQVMWIMELRDNPHRPVIFLFMPKHVQAAPIRWWCCFGLHRVAWGIFIMGELWLASDTLAILPLRRFRSRSLTLSQNTYNPSSRLERHKV
jgi:hypothetical protein